MIKNATVEEKKDVLALWKSCYPNQNPKYLEFYFDQIYDQGVCVVQKQDDKLISSVQMNYHTFQFLGKQLKCSHLLGAATLADYRRRGHFDQLMNSILDEANHNCLISFIRAFHPKAFEKYGFDVVYERKAYTIPHKCLLDVKTHRVSQIADSFELLSIYQAFTSRFDGFYVRDLQYYDILSHELLLEHKKLYVYRDQEHKIQGYIIAQVNKHEIVIQEAIYMNSSVLKSLLKAAMVDKKELRLLVSTHEQIEKIFPLTIPKKQAFIMARINNVSLFNKLYNCDIKTAKEAFSLVNKPLWNHEYY